MFLLTYKRNYVCCITINGPFYIIDFPQTGSHMQSLYFTWWQHHIPTQIATGTSVRHCWQCHICGLVKVMLPVVMHGINRT